MNITIPKTVYRTPNPEIGEYYCVFAEILPSANHLVKRWVVKETHGWFDDVTKKALNKLNTLSPTDAEHCVSLDEAFTLIEKQILSRARDGYKYLYEFDPYSGKTTFTEINTDRA